jgi:hypothetical protein
MTAHLPIHVAHDERLFLIDRIVQIAFTDDEVLDEWGLKLLLPVQYIACGTFFEAPPDLFEFLKKRFPDGEDLIWKFIFPMDADVIARKSKD